MFDPTDLDRMRDMFTAANIEFESMPPWRVSHTPTDTTVILKVVGGYNRFYTEFAFSADGALLSVKAFE